MKQYINKKIKIFKLLMLSMIIFIFISILYIKLKHNFKLNINNIININSNIKLNIYKFWYIKYQRIFNNKLKSRFNQQDLEIAVKNARSQPWVMKQIKADLNPFLKKGLSSKYIDQLFTYLTKDLHLKYHLIKFKIQNHTLYVYYVDEIIGFLRSYKTIYEVIKILNEYRLISDCTFIIYLNDYFDYVPTGIKQPIPIFSFAKDTEIPIEKNTILIPDWMNIYYWDVLRGRIEHAKKIYPWSKKESLIHWRGGGIADSLQHRKKLINLREKLLFLDVGMTEGSNKVDFLYPEFSLKYKYQVALDGERCAWERVVWQMYSNCLMLKPKSTQVQWFYRGLKANYNYFPLDDISRSDLIEGYNWLVNNDLKVQEMIKNANDFAKNNFKTQDFLAYYVLLLQEYAKLMK